MSLRSGAAALLLFLTAVAASAPIAATEESPLTGIELPRIGFPAFVAPGGGIGIRLVGEVSVVAARIENEFGEYELSLEGATLTDGRTEVEAVLPPEAPPGLYDLVVELEGGEVRREPNSVAVLEDLDPPFTVFWISDTHYDNRPGQLHQAAQFVRDIWLINFLRPDFVIHTGDVCNNPHEVIFQGVRRLMPSFDVPVILIPGNHDHSIKGVPFVRYLAPSNLSLDIGPDVHVVSVDTGPGSLEGRLSVDQVEWLDRDLSASNATVKIVLFHHPPWNLEATPGANSDTVIQLMAERGVTAALSGHMHENYVYTEPILMVTNPNSYGDVEKAVEKAIPGYRIFTIEPDGGLRWLGGVEKPIPLNWFEVEHYQVNDGSAGGFSAKVVNRSPWPINGTLVARISGSGSVQAEGGTLLEVRESRLGYSVAYVTVTVPPGQEKVVKVWAAEDSSPPTVEFHAEPKVGGTVVIRVNLTVRDDVLGVSEVSLWVSTDGQSWREVELLRLDEDTFLATTQVPREVGQARFRVEALDLSGKSTTLEEVVSWGALTGPTVETGEEEVQLPLWVLGVAILAAATAVAAFKLRR
ncbi:MAG: hypothetical protein DRO01_02705 [Thermoproteota archaeon]|nr:MAG: hypothetical protein DRO01_02705 [Candidatus Korarchaeota archaeon]